MQKMRQALGSQKRIIESANIQRDESHTRQYKRMRLFYY